MFSKGIFFECSPDRAAKLEKLQNEKKARLARFGIYREELSDLEKDLMGYPTSRSERAYHLSNGCVYEPRVEDPSEWLCAKCDRFLRFNDFSGNQRKRFAKPSKRDYPPWCKKCLQTFKHDPTEKLSCREWMLANRPWKMVDHQPEPEVVKPAAASRSIQTDAADSDFAAAIKSLPAPSRDREPPQPDELEQKVPELPPIIPKRKPNNEAPPRIVRPPRNRISRKKNLKQKPARGKPAVLKAPVPRTTKHKKGSKSQRKHRAPVMLKSISVIEPNMTYITQGPQAKASDAAPKPWAGPQPEDQAVLRYQDLKVPPKPVKVRKRDQIQQDRALALSLQQSVADLEPIEEERAFNYDLVAQQFGIGSGQGEASLTCVSSIGRTHRSQVEGQQD